MCLIGKGEEFLVASAITKGYEGIFASIGILSQNTIHLLWAVTILGEEMARQLSTRNLYLRAENCNLGQIIGKTVRTGEEWLHPIVDAGADNDDIGSRCP